MSYDFGDIREKVRKVTGRLSSDSMSDQELNEYINKYLQYTFPAEFKLDSNLAPYSFLTVSGQQDYVIPVNFTNFLPSAYSNGAEMRFFTNQNLYYQYNNYYYRTRIYPSGASSGITGFTNANPGVITVVNAGDFTAGDLISVSGVVELAVGTQSLNGTYNIASIAGNQLTLVEDTTTYHTYVSSGLVSFTSTIVYSQANQNYPILPGSVIVSDGVETFTDNGTGTLTGSLGGTGVVNYATGAITATFITAPGSITSVWVSYITYQSGQPQYILNFDGNFKLYPIPDGVYRINLVGYEVPDELINSLDTPKLQQWGAVIAYGASRDICADAGEFDRYAEITALYKEQVKYVNRRDIQDTLYRSSIRSD